MPQPALDIHKYLSFVLPPLQEKYPPGTGGTGARSDFSGNLQSVETVENFQDLTLDCEYKR